MSAIRPAIRPALRPAIRSVFGGAGAAPVVWTPASLFAASEVGVWYDPSDLSTLWQDTAGTTPVTAAGQAVARMDDKSGNGLHITQDTAANRPLLQTAGGLYYLDYDGTDDIMTRAAVAGSAWTVIVGASQDNDATGGLVFGNRTATADRFGVRLDNSIAAIGHYNGAWLTKSRGSTSGGVPDTSPHVLSALVSEGSSVTAYYDGSTMTDTGTPLSNSTDIMAIGGSTTSSYNLDGKVYGIILRAALSSAEDFALAQAWIAAKAGVTL